MKTEAIWFGTKAGLKKLNGADVNLHVANVTIQPVSVVRYLGVWLDSELSMKTHINKTVRTCFYQLHRLKQVRRIIDQKTAANLVTSLVCPDSTGLLQCCVCWPAKVNYRFSATGSECSCTARC